MNKIKRMSKHPIFLAILAHELAIIRDIFSWLYEAEIGSNNSCGRMVSSEVPGPYSRTCADIKHRARIDYGRFEQFSMKDSSPKLMLEVKTVLFVLIVDLILVDFAATGNSTATSLTPSFGK